MGTKLQIEYMYVDTDTHPNMTILNLSASLWIHAEKEILPVVRGIPEANSCVCNVIDLDACSY